MLRRAATLTIVCILLLVWGLVLPPASSLPQGIAAQATGTSRDLRIGYLDTVSSLNPFRGFGDTSFELYGMLYDDLVSVDQDGNFVFNLVVVVTIDPSETNWTFQIRSGVLWSDGTPLTAEDVAFTFNYNIANFSLLSAYEPYVSQIKRCTSPTDLNCGARVTSPGSVSIYFDRPFTLGTHLLVPIIQQRQWQNISPYDAQNTFQNLVPIGTGPFIADPQIGSEWMNNQPLLLHKNPNYHPLSNHLGPPNIGNVSLIHFSDENQMVAALEAGQIDVAQFTSSGYDALSNAANIQRQEGLLCTQYQNEIGFSQSNNSAVNPASYDENVRRAMAMATNKDYIVKTIYGGRGVRGADLISPVTPQWSFDPTKYPGVNLTYDLAAANDLLNRSGYTTWSEGSFGKGVREATYNINFVDTNGINRTVPAGSPLDFNIYTSQDFPQDLSTAEYLMANYAKIGITIGVLSESETAFLQDVYTGRAELYVRYWTGDPDPNYLLSIESNYTLGLWNDNFWDNATYNALYAKQLADPLFTASRQQDVLAAQELHYNSSVYITYVYPYGEWAWRTDTFTGWGDWVAHPYRQLDNHWGANPLLLDLVPMPPPGQLEGTVRGVDSETLVNATVSVLSLTGQRYNALTNSEGRYNQSLPPGSYNLTVNATGYYSENRTGIVVASGAFVEADFYLTPFTYSVAFTQVGLPAGTEWSITLNERTVNSTGSSATFAEPNGTYSFTVGAVPGFTATPSNGSVIVAGQALTKSVTFTAIHQGATFLGLPAWEGYSVIALFAAVVVLGAILAWAWSRRKGPREPPPKENQELKL